MCITDMLACVYTYHVILVNVLDCIHVCEVYNIILLKYYDVIQCIYIELDTLPVMFTIVLIISTLKCNLLNQCMRGR